MGIDIVTAVLPLRPLTPRLTAGMKGSRAANESCIRSTVWGLFLELGLECARFFWPYQASPEADMHPAERHWLPRIRSDTPPELPVTAYAVMSAQSVPILTG